MNKVDMAGVDLVEFAKKVYELSTPQGLGFLHFQDGGLSEEEAKDIVGAGRFGDSILSMDYVKGRACKMHVYEVDGKRFIQAPWYDHTDGQLQELLEAFKLGTTNQQQHGPACNCKECNPSKVEHGIVER